MAPLVIGKAKMPRSFGKRIPLGIRWYFNKKAWMTTNVFLDYLEWLNSMVTEQKRRIALILDNAPCHPSIVLPNVELIFLPPNTTAKTQPLDAGIIRSLKLH